MSSNESVTTSDLECCPTLERDDCCDRLDFKYTLTHKTDVKHANQVQTIPVDVTIIVRFERCPGEFVLGDLAYTTTLLPGEKVRLFSSDRRSRFSFDKETNLSYRHAQATEEQFYMSSVAREMYDLNASESGSASSHVWGDWGADMDSSYGTVVFAGGASGSIDGHYDDQSTRDFAHSLSRHAESTHSRSVQATKTTSAISIGEVSTRTHMEGESESHLEAASRQFSNPNRCHALNFFFWRIHRKQKVKFSIVSIERAVQDTAAPTNLNSHPPLTPTGVSAIPASVLATDHDRLDAEERAQKSVEAKIALGKAADHKFSATRAGETRMVTPEPIPKEAREEAVKNVDERLVRARLLDKVGGKVHPEIVKELSWEREACLPTPGVFVKSCLDECGVCEPSVLKEIELDLEKRQLENQLLQKQIDLLENSQQYRCCPVGEEEEDADD